MRTTEPIRIDLAPDQWLIGQWSFSGRPTPHAVVYLHGFRSVRNGEKAQALEEACARRGWTYAAFDFRCHGESSGTMRELRASQLLADLEAIRVCLSQRGVTRLGLVGSSMGGWAAAWFSMRQPTAVAASVLLAPGFHFLTARWDKLTPAERERWRKEGFLRIRNEWVDVDLGYSLVEEAPQFPQEELLQGLTRPTMILHGMKDDIVPYSRSLAFIEKTACPQVELRLYKDGDHRLTDRKHELAETACEFVGRWS
jgi:pimeloyl-ACP methyl ester carboxylesterase